MLNVELKRSRYKTFADLYVEGTELVLDEPTDTNPGLFVWIQRPSPAEMDDIHARGLTAKSLAVLSLKDPESAEMTRFSGDFVSTDVETLVESLVQGKIQEFTQAAEADVRADKDWTEKFDMFLDTDPATVTDPALRRTLDKVGEEILAEIRDRANAAVNAYREDTMARGERDRDLLRDEVLDAYIEFRGSQALMDTMNYVEGYYSFRVCDATRTEQSEPHVCVPSCDHWDISQCRDGAGNAYPDTYVGIRHAGFVHDESRGCVRVPEANMPPTVTYTYDHSACDHRVKVFESAEELKEAPAPVQNRLISGLYNFRMRKDEAKK